MGKADRPKDVKRGTSDELEILREIVLADKYLYDKIVQKIKSLTATSKAGIIDELGSKQISSRERDRLSKKAT